jgi:hypothetical protein
MNLLARVLSLLLVAFWNTASHAAESKLNWQAEWERTVKAAEEEGQLTVYIAGYGALIDSGVFQKAYPKIKVTSVTGSGTQLAPRIVAERRASGETRDDLLSMILWAATGEVKGPVNAVAPEPVRNLDFSRALGAAVRRPAVLPVPEVALKVMFGEMATILLGSSRVVPETAQRHGFRWQFGVLQTALARAVVD